LDLSIQRYYVTQQISFRLERTPMAKTAKKKKAPARKPNAAFMKPVTPSAALAAVIGSKAMPRTEVTKKLWAYIKKNGLQDPKNKRMIKADAALKPVFANKATVNMFEMTKLVSKHLSSVLRAVGGPSSGVPAAHASTPSRKRARWGPRACAVGCPWPWRGARRALGPWPGNGFSRRGRCGGRRPVGALRSAGVHSDQHRRGAAVPCDRHRRDGARRASRRWSPCCAFATGVVQHLALAEPCHRDSYIPSTASAAEAFHFVEYGLVVCFYRFDFAQRAPSVSRGRALSHAMTARQSCFRCWPESSSAHSTSGSSGTNLIRAGEGEMSSERRRQRCGLLALASASKSPDAHASARIRRASACVGSPQRCCLRVLSVGHIGHDIRDPEIGVFGPFYGGRSASLGRDRIERWRVAPPVVLRRLSAGQH
jgi:hypothetical protein